MNVTNRDIAAAFNEIAELLDIEGANPFRIRAYRNAARTLLSYPKEMQSLVDEGFDLTSLKTIGKDLAQKITEMVRSGEMKLLNDLKHRIDPELEELLKIPGIGPKRVHLLYELLRVKSIQALKKALENGSLERIAGFGAKLLQTLRTALGKKTAERKRYRLYDILPIAQQITDQLSQAKGVIRIEIAGSIRRRRDTAKDIDLVAACEDESDIMGRFTSLPDLHSVVMHGPTRSSIILKNGMHVDLRVVSENEFGTALHHLTGSKAHNIELRKIASKRGIKINEYGVFIGEQKIASNSETALYKALSMPYIAPELRENQGEIEAAFNNTLPYLIQSSQIRGDLHVHTAYSDGMNTLEEMATAAQAKGYEYLAITDHTRHLHIAHGLDENRVLEQLEQIDRLNGSLEGIRLLKSAEVDILSDGTLDLSDTVLKQLDFAVCAVHYRFNISKKEQTYRILKAMENPYFTILAHPTGRLLGLREPYELDMEAIIKECAHRGIILELNSQPDRLDLNDTHCRMAKEAGVKIAVSTDAHSTHDLELMEMGIGQARRGWLEKKDVINTRSLPALMKILRQRR
ncbi:MAG: DNA polymerase/3'-5' exonuclease PolX [Sulfuricurvum sp.]|nr:DNA polymerase/3'-5' exonuclease PolX [Sulfuricurvum sp.]